MFARKRSTRGHMKFPSFAQQGERGVRGVSGELDPTKQVSPSRKVMQHEVEANL